MSGPTPADPDVLLSLAVGVAVRAGHLVRDAARARPGARQAVGTKSSPTDVVTAMDRAAERLIVGALLGARPDDTVAGEEGGVRAGSSGGSSGVRWHVDPIDGTVNYMYGLPHYCVSVAAESGGEVVAAAVFAPALDALYTAVAGGGAYLGGERLQVATTADLARALVATGFGYESGRRAHQGAVVAHVLPRIRDIRRYGSAALDLCGVAAGAVDGYWESGLHDWDLAGGSLVAREAGAVVAGFRGAAPGAEMALAANPALFPSLHDAVLDGYAGAGQIAEGGRGGPEAG